MKKPLNTVFILIAGIIAMSAGLWLATLQTEQTQNTPRIQGAIYPQAKTISPFSLLTHKNKTFTQSDFLNDWGLIFVGYTHCPDICPTTLSLLNEVDKIYSEQNLDSVNIYFLSIDPERDSVDVMQQYINYFNENFTGLTGSMSEVNKLSSNLNAVYRKAPGLSGKITEDDYLMDHSSALMLINPDGKLQSILTAPHSTNSIITSIITSQTYYKSL